MEDETMRFVYAGAGLFLFWMIWAAFIAEQESILLSEDAFWIASAIVFAGGMAGRE